jgi:hypothetical protein
MRSDRAPLRVNNASDAIHPKHQKKKKSCFFFSLSSLTLLSQVLALPLLLLLACGVSSVFGRANGAGTCTVYGTLEKNPFEGMNARARDGVNTVTVTPSTAKPGETVVIKVQVDAPNVEIVGVLGTVYEVVEMFGLGTIQDGVHTPVDGLKLCEDRIGVGVGGVSYAITHAAPLVGKTSLSWNYTLWRDAGVHVGKLEVRVVTLNGKAGDPSSQKWALGTAIITVPGNSTTAATTAGTGPGATTTATATATATGGGGACKDLACADCIKNTACSWCDTARAGASLVNKNTSVTTGSCTAGTTCTLGDRVKFTECATAAADVVQHAALALLALLLVALF